jgi:putative transposase
MGRPKRIFSDQYPYHITARCINKEWFNLPIEEVWDIFSNHLFFCHHGFKAQIHAFVLMNNHFHLLISTPLGNIDKIMYYVMKETSREITFKSRRINQTYGGPYFASLITKDIHFNHAYKYIYRNPVDAGLCHRAENYTFSTLHALIGLRKTIIPLVSDELLIPNMEHTLNWINTAYSSSARDDIKHAMKKSTFKLPRSLSGHANALEIKNS